MLTWRNTSWDFKNKRPEIAILPLAAFEPHGPHLPVGSDLIIMDAIAQAVAERLSGSVFLMPTWPLGTSGHFAGEAGAIYLGFESLWAVVDDLVHSLHGHGIRQVVVLNNHGAARTTTTVPLGNFIVKTAVRQLNYELPGITAIWVQPFSAARTVLAALFDSAGEDIQAGAIETSILLHLLPELVGERGPDHEPGYGSALLNFTAFRNLAPDGVWGRPSEATAERGAQALTAAVEATAGYIEKTLAQLAQMKNVEEVS
ncbi:MAG: creatininase family protein [Candidatus Promineifilaceae bacterium]|jgi:creatinine amidohydrolase